MPPELSLVKALLEAGAAGTLMVAGYYFLRYLQQERDDRNEERELWRAELTRERETAATEREQMRKEVTEKLALHDQRAAEAHERFGAVLQQVAATLTSLNGNISICQEISKAKIRKAS